MQLDVIKILEDAISTIVIYSFTIIICGIVSEYAALSGPKTQ